MNMAIIKILTVFFFVTLVVNYGLHANIISAAQQVKIDVEKHINHYCKNPTYQDEEGIIRQVPAFNISQYKILQEEE